MSDELKPGENAGNAEQNPSFKNFSMAAPQSAAAAAPADEPEEVYIPATERLAAAEKKLLGDDVPRHDGKPERGHGSKFQALHPAHKAHLAAIEHLIEVEAEHAAAEAHLSAIHARVERARERVDATEEASKGAE